MILVKMDILEYDLLEKYASEYIYCSFGFIDKTYLHKGPKGI